MVKKYKTVELRLNFRVNARERPPPPECAVTSVQGSCIHTTHVFAAQLQGLNREGGRKYVAAIFIGCVRTGLKNRRFKAA